MCIREFIQTTIINNVYGLYSYLNTIDYTSYLINTDSCNNTNNSDECFNICFNFDNEEYEEYEEYDEETPIYQKKNTRYYNSSDNLIVTFNIPLLEDYKENIDNDNFNINYICYNCFKNVNSPTYFYNDHIFCSPHCRYKKFINDYNEEQKK